MKDFSIPRDVSHDNLMPLLDSAAQTMSDILNEITDALMGRRVVRLDGLLSGASGQIVDVAVSPSAQGYVVLVRARVHPDAPKTWSDAEYSQRANENNALLVLGRECVLLNVDDTPDAS